MTTTPTMPPEPWATVTKMPDGSFKVEFTVPFRAWLTALWRNAGATNSTLSNNVNSGVAAAQAAADAAQATADAAAQQANDVGGAALPFSASISPAVATGSGKVNITTNSVTATPVGGTGPYTYAWSYVSGDAVTVLSPTAAATAFRSNISAGGVYRCTITDFLLATATATVGVSITSTSE